MLLNRDCKKIEKPLLNSIHKSFSALLHDSLFPNTFSEHSPTKHVKWSTYNQSLVRRGELAIAFDVINNWDTELKEMNKDKVGEPFHYPNTFLLLLGYAKAYFHLPYRQTEGIAQEGMLKENYHLYPILQQ